jgi:hypothetical protein
MKNPRENGRMKPSKTPQHLNPTASLRLRMIGIVSFRLIAAIAWGIIIRPD